MEEARSAVSSVFSLSSPRSFLDGTEKMEIRLPRMTRLRTRQERILCWRQRVAAAGPKQERGKQIVSFVASSLRLFSLPPCLEPPTILQASFRRKLTRGCFGGYAS